MGTGDHPQAENTPFFVTTTTWQRRPLFRNARAAEFLLEELYSLRSQLGFALLGFVIMPEHLHMVVVPGPTAGLSKIMQGIKGRFARMWNIRQGGKGNVWQPRYYEAAARTEAQLAHWLNYIEFNPVKAGLSDSQETYVYSSASGRFETDLEAYLQGSWRAGLKPGLQVLES